MPKLVWTDSASHTQSGLTSPTAARARFQNSTGTKGGHVAAEAVDDPRPHLQALDLIVPERALAVVEVDHVGPVADLVAGLSLRPAPEEVRMLFKEQAVCIPVPAMPVKPKVFLLPVPGFLII